MISADALDALDREREQRAAEAEEERAARAREEAGVQLGGGGSSVGGGNRNKCDPTQLSQVRHSQIPPLQMSAPLCFCHHDMHCFSSWQAGSSLGGLLGGGTQAGRGTNAGAAGGVTDTMEAAALLEVLNGGVRAVVVEGGPGPAAQKAPDPEPPSAPAPNRPAAAAAAAADDDEQQREVRHQICSTFYIAALCSLGVYQNRVHIPQDVTKASHIHKV